MKKINQEQIKIINEDLLKLADSFDVIIMQINEKSDQYNNYIKLFEELKKNEKINSIPDDIEERFCGILAYAGFAHIVAKQLLNLIEDWGACKYGQSSNGVKESIDKLHKEIINER
jgi:hypothetical protein